MSKKSIGLILLFALLFSLISPMAKAEAADTFKVKVGKKITLASTLKNPVWGSTDTSIATVSDKGVVKGIKKGTCYVTATADNKSELFKISVTKKAKKTTTATAPTEPVIMDSKTESELKIYLEGKEVILGKTTYGEILKMTEGSGYSFRDKKSGSELQSAPFSMELVRTADPAPYDESQIIFKFKAPETYLAQDAVLYSVLFVDNADYHTFSNTYCFDERFMFTKIPDFEDFIKSKDQLIIWKDKANQGWTISGTSWNFDFSASDQNVSIGFSFNKDTHKCTGIYWRISLY